ncbi:hypothetical protein D9757_003683 [Collybiopsis confluens]|uniref:Uncharacterized protein n=1 Tax=Collybiopsis confluens TaxID=2823264 RepID=A0A8H5HV80_9AGAR|nr:hypothetical protein D9757_003683 [Collybiopsis confluens]
MPGGNNYNMVELFSELFDCIHRDPLFSFLDSIPSGTKVPHWAYQDVVTSDHFNATLAQLTGDSPETISGAQSTSASTPSSPVTASSPSSTSSSAAQGDTSKSSKSHTGAIVGGVVGGVVGLALIIAAIYRVLRKHSHDRNTRARPQPISGHDHELSPEMTGTTNAPSMSAYPPVQQKLYSPDDPSTFPPNVISPSTPTMTHAPYSSVIDVGSVYNQPSTFGHNINISPAGPRKTYPGYAEV